MKKEGRKEEVDSSVRCGCQEGVRSALLGIDFVRWTGRGRERERVVKLYR